MMIPKPITSINRVMKIKTTAAFLPEAIVFFVYGKDNQKPAYNKKEPIAELL